MGNLEFGKVFLEGGSGISKCVEGGNGKADAGTARFQLGNDCLAPGQGGGEEGRFNSVLH